MADTILNDLRAAVVADTTLSALIAKRYYPDVAPQSASVPYIVYTDISLATDQDLNGTNGNRTTRIQFDVYATTKAKARTLREALLALFDGYQGTLRAGAVVIQHTQLANLRSGFEPGDKVYHYGMDFTFDYKI